MIQAPFRISNTVGNSGPRVESHFGCRTQYQTQASYTSDGRIVYLDNFAIAQIDGDARRRHISRVAPEAFLKERKTYAHGAPGTTAPSFILGSTPLAPALPMEWDSKTILDSLSASVRGF